MKCEERERERERERICFYGDKVFLNPHWCSPPFPRWRGRRWVARGATRGEENVGFTERTVHMIDLSLMFNLLFYFVMRCNACIETQKKRPNRAVAQILSS